ncbi:beta-1,4-galactosyltransferase 4-like isoform X2 [Cololabis saira]|uniref:beta-1,4-galactosyltransferase 4-like isoform X2 n=1 Tax=Cololabis saira TaxID=129043 RepID=UPI002AD3D7C8|nr:beta-1,4-galactosyltransferase 4-like isoform X2 [Cololabis saira]
MWFCLAVGDHLYRRRYFLLSFFSVLVLVWIAIFSGEALKIIPVFSATMQTRKDNLMDQPDNGTSTPDQLYIATQKGECPVESPLLQGLVKPSFESSLTLKNVENENKGVSEGEYEPSGCTARQSVAIIIPHRWRETHLIYFLYHLHPFLQRQQLHYAIYVVHQAGDATFNRAKLMNVGYLEALKDHSWDCFIFHDVDLIPENDKNVYICDDNRPKHLIVGRNSTGYKLRYQNNFGGVTAFTREQFQKVNGFPNVYWGWGGEDDDLYTRVRLQNMKIVRPPADVARYTMMFHKGDPGNEKNPKRMKLLQQTSSLMKTDGINSCSYKTLSVERLLLYVNVTVDIGKP